MKANHDVKFYSKKDDSVANYNQIISYSNLAKYIGMTLDLNFVRRSLQREEAE